MVCEFGTGERRYDVYAPGCPSEQALELIASKWTALVVILLAEGTKRYSELQRAIPAVSHKMLTQTLRRLEEKHLIVRQVYAEVPPRVEYSLTPVGETLVPTLRSLRDWAEAHAYELGLGKQAAAEESA